MLDEQSTPEQTSTVEKPEPAKTTHKINPWFLWTRDVAICLILVLFFRGYVAEANYIPSISMEPTLNVSDRIIVDKLSLNWHPLERGELVVFHPPIPGKENERWIKRVIGLPGDVIEIIQGKVYVNGSRAEEPYVDRRGAYSMIPITLKEDDPSTKINEGEYYFLGDNRRNSRDSHEWGPCPAENVIGRAIFRYWPLSNMGSLTHSKDGLVIENK